MRIYSIGDGIMDETKADLAEKPCVVLVCDSRDELGTALHGIGFRDPVTVTPHGALHKLRARVLGIDPFLNPINELQRLQAELSAPIVGVVEPPSSQESEGKP